MNKSLLWIVVLLAGLFSIPQEALCQSSKNNQLRLPDNREALSLAQKAVRWERQGEYSRAIALYFQILKNDDSEVMKVEKERRVGVSYYIFQKIRTLSPPAQKIFREIYGKKAYLVLQDALGQRGQKKRASLEKISRLYFPTMAGIQANVLLANSLLEKGRFRQAFQQYYSLLDLSLYPPNLSKSLLIGKCILALKGVVNFSQLDLLPMFKIEGSFLANLKTGPLPKSLYVPMGQGGISLLPTTSLQKITTEQKSHLWWEIHHPKGPFLLRVDGPRGQVYFSKIRKLYRLACQAPPLVLHKQKLSLKKYFLRTLEGLFSFQIRYRHLKNVFRARILKRTAQSLRLSYQEGTIFVKKSEIFPLVKPRLELHLPGKKSHYTIREDSPIFGGDNTHRAVSASFPKVGKKLFGPFPLLYSGIKKQLPRSYGYRNRYYRSRSSFSRGSYVYPFYGTIYRDGLYVAGPQKLLGYSLNQTFPPFNISPNVFLPNAKEVNSEMLYAPLAYKDRLYCSFIVNPNFISAENFRAIAIKARIPQRRLMCFNRFTGKKLWEKKGLEDPFFKQVTLPISPIVRDNVLYSIALRIKGYVQLFVVALDGETGKTLWKRWISSSSTATTMFGFHAREPLCTMLAESEGIIYCATSQGAMTALRASDGQIIWQNKYTTIPIYQSRYYQARQRAIRWANNPPVVVQGKVCVAPMDSPYFYVFDKYTGKILWRKARILSNGQVRYLVGASRGMVFLSDQQVVAYDLTTGKKRWQSPLYNSKATGRGMICRDSLAFPVRESPSKYNQFRIQNKLIVIDILSGLQRQHIVFPRSIPLGNLVVTKKYILLVSENKVTVLENNP